MKLIASLLALLFSTRVLGFPQNNNNDDDDNDDDTLSDQNIQGKTVPVGFGQQIQTTSEINYWVVWVEGKDACAHMQTLTPFIGSPCNITFRLPGAAESVMLGQCDGNNSPHALFLASGEYDRSCGSNANQKIHCHGYVHDIIKHGACKKYTGAMLMGKNKLVGPVGSTIDRRY
ncbi:hypothetical protein GGR50DRAFT_698470 [Xylaria sp. CBS 124048]|nr:hypothetical protein GGR50DRAFT_698470 [Xylaria sp. CBS 124048]